MMKLVKVEDEIFKDVYVGTNGNRKVTCILDTNCVRYIVFENGKRVRRSEFSNDQKEKCFTNAEKALNRN